LYIQASVIHTLRRAKSYKNQGTDLTRVDFAKK